MKKFSIFNFQFSIDQQGFTIVEALVVAAVVGIMGVILTDLLSRTINGGNKTDTINNVKQNGQVVLNVMTQTIRQSSQIICDGSIGNEETLVVLDASGRYGRFHYYPPQLSAPLANGQIKYEFLVDSTNSSANPDPTIVSDLLCNSQEDATSSPGFVVDASMAPLVLTDTSIATGISVNICPSSSPPVVLSKISSPGSPDIAKIDMCIKPGLSAPADYTHQLGSADGIEFTTSVQVQ